MAASVEARGGFHFYVSAHLLAKVFVWGAFGPRLVAPLEPSRAVPGRGGRAFEPRLAAPCHAAPSHRTGGPALDVLLPGRADRDSPCSGIASLAAPTTTASTRNLLAGSAACDSLYPEIS